jgi:hypothetical protein
LTCSVAGDHPAVVVPPKPIPKTHQQLTSDSCSPCRSTARQHSPISKKAAHYPTQRGGHRRASTTTHSADCRVLSLSLSLSLSAFPFFSCFCFFCPCLVVFCLTDRGGRRNNSATHVAVALSFFFFLLYIYIYIDT